MARRTPLPDLPLGEALRVRGAGITTVGLAVRIAVATTVSYFVAVQVSGSSFVLFAPITTLLVVQASPFATVGASLQRVLGTLVGVLLATLYVQVVDVNTFTFGLAILVALLLARLLPVSLASQLQIPVAVVFVLLLGTESLHTDLWRVLDVLIGGTVGVLAVYAWPDRPDIEPAEAASQRFRSALNDQLRAIGREVGTLDQPLADERKHRFTVSSRALRQVSTAAREEYADALNSVRFHPRARRASGPLEQVAARVTWLSGLAIQIRALGGAADRLYDRPGLQPALAPTALRQMLDLCADLVDAVDSGRSAVPSIAEAVRADVALALDQVALERVKSTEVLQSITLLGRIDLLVDSILRPTGLSGPGDDEVDEDEEAVAAAGPGAVSDPGPHPAADGDR